MNYGTGLFNTLTNKNTLLNYRLSEISKLLRDAKLIKEKIINHNQRVQWQIQRLYRIRNEIAHNAYHDKLSLVIYIEQIYDYLVFYITELIYFSSRNPFNELMEAVSAIDDYYSIYIEDSNHFQKLLLNGIMDY